MSLMETKCASGVSNYNPGTFDDYLYHWVDATAGGRFVADGITSPVVSTAVIDMNINYMVSFINFLLQNLNFLKQLSIFLSQK